MSYRNISFISIIQLTMFHSLLAFTFFILPFIYGIPYGIPESDDTLTGIQMPASPQLLDPGASAAPPLDAAGLTRKSNILDGWIIADAFSPGNLDASNSIIPTTDTSQSFFSTADISNPSFPTTDESQALVVAAGLSDPTYDFSLPYNQGDSGGVSTDNLNVGGSTDTFDLAFRAPPPVGPDDKPNYNTPNCEGQEVYIGKKPAGRLKLLSCCNSDQSRCVYYKATHFMCQLHGKTPGGPNHPIQCCDDVPMEGSKGINCRNANNPFNVHIPAISTPFGSTPEINYKVDMPAVQNSGPAGEAINGAGEGGGVRVMEVPGVP